MVEALTCAAQDRRWSLSSARRRLHDSESLALRIEASGFLHHGGGLEVKSMEKLIDTTGNMAPKIPGCALHHTPELLTAARWYCRQGLNGSATAAWRREGAEPS